MKPLTAALAALLLVACASDGTSAWDEFKIRRASAFDGLAATINDACSSYQDGTACDDGYVDLDRFGDDPPLQLAGAIDDYCGLLDAGGSYAALARGVVIFRVNTELRKRGSPVFRSGVCV